MYILNKVSQTLHLIPKEGGWHVMIAYEEGKHDFHVMSVLLLNHNDQNDFLVMWDEDARKYVLKGMHVKWLDEGMVVPNVRVSDILGYQEIYTKDDLKEANRHLIDYSSELSLSSFEYTLLVMAGHAFRKACDLRED